jgi:hypothetical protein
MTPDFVVRANHPTVMRSDSITSRTRYALIVAPPSDTIPVRAIGFIKASISRNIRSQSQGPQDLVHSREKLCR